MDAKGNEAKKDGVVRIADEPDHNELCKREQEYLYKAITEDIDLTDHVADAVNSLRICFAAVDSYRTGRAIHLSGDGTTSPGDRRESVFISRRPRACPSSSTR